MKMILVWADESREPMKADVEACYPDQGFLIIEYGPDLLAPGVNTRMQMFPASQIASVELVEEDEKKGYREDNTFREDPLSHKFGRAMGANGGRTT